MILKLKKKEQINLKTVASNYGIFRVPKFILKNEKIIFYVNNDGDFSELDQAKFLVFSNGKIDIINIDKELIKSKKNDEYEKDSVELITHNNDILAFVTKRKKTGNYDNVKYLSHILKFDTDKLQEPTIITLTNELEAVDTKHRKGRIFCRQPSIRRVYSSNNNEFPTIIYDGNDQFNINTIKIDFKNLTAEWTCTKEIDFTRLDLADSCSFIGTPEALDYLGNPNEYEYRSMPYYQFSSLLMNDEGIIFFAMGTRDSFRKYGMYRYVFLGKLEKIEKKYELSKVYEKAFFDAEEYEGKLGIKFGRTALFSTDQKHVIIYSEYKSSDPWGFREKVFNLEQEILYDVEFPRGFNKHKIIDINNNLVLTFGENSKSEDILTIFDFDILKTTANKT
ncbi:hypothetical protein [Flavicella sp.]|uniref:hypothetical protein n=1 Tax=Flavicella sp. TaxID=2957742 RepID=UPI0030176BDF